MSQTVWGTQSPSGFQGQSPGRGLGDVSFPQKLKHFCKYKPSNLRPRENNYFNNKNNKIKNKINKIKIITSASVEMTQTRQSHSK